MAERLKAHVLKTCLGHTNVGSNPTPSATSSSISIDDTHDVARLMSLGHNRGSAIVNRKS
jgi:hypothetical protein